MFILTIRMIVLVRNVEHIALKQKLPRYYAVLYPSRPDYEPLHVYQNKSPLLCSNAVQCSPANSMPKLLLFTAIPSQIQYVPLPNRCRRSHSHRP